MKYQPAILEIAQKGGRYPYEAYDFIEEALKFTQKRLGRDPGDVTPPDARHHISGPELAVGAVEYAKQEFGMLANAVFRHWKLTCTDDIGEIVFHLIDAGILYKNENDSRDHFHQLFDLEHALTEDFAISLAETPWSKRGTR
ncbi:hypothetical protein KIH39_16540 [Telmatocola sphagniphila]|uniref:Uncharacterized protein n=1 Tax=Telmatocola sphagniphila TaxID=1123043 RepID=A0A8E6ETV6_9BACT|nr:Minf_1886 family protein [Telmatocola sphagniphila]QVL30457.1 hypothetical protein KIH39_16540 [Telmatocola sphagniphila]